MKAENSKDDVADVQSILYEAIDREPDRWYLKNEIPTLGEVRGKIVLATRFDDKLAVGSERCGLYFGWADQGDRTVLADPTAVSAINGSETLCVQDRYNYDVDDKITAIHTCLDNSQADEDTFFLNFTSTSGSGKVGHPKEYAKHINLDLYDYDWQAGTAYGIVIVDFAPKKLQRRSSRRTSSPRSNERILPIKKALCVRMCCTQRAFCMVMEFNTASRRPGCGDRP